jgi:hypothetical protein
LNRGLYFLTNGKDTGQDALLSQLDDPEFKEAVKVIKGYTKDQKQRHWSYPGSRIQRSGTQGTYRGSEQLLGFGLKTEGRYLYLKASPQPYPGFPLLVARMGIGYHELEVRNGGNTWIWQR